MKKIIETPEAPAAIGPYSQAVEAGGILFLSGQIPLDPATGKIQDSDIKSQTLRVMKNIEAILTEAGYSFADVVKSTCYLSDLSNFRAMNEVYSLYYVEKQPARVTLAVKELPLGALVEIDTIAVKGAGK